jgi:hypothetical protein
MPDFHLGHQELLLSRFTSTHRSLKSGKLAGRAAAQYMSGQGIFLHRKIIKGEFYAAEIQAFNADTFSGDRHNNMLFNDFCVALSEDKAKYV